MKDPSLVSIIINNYNYSNFLKDAIDSALNQTYYPVEVIAVDDGSTDCSRDIIASYGERVYAVFQQNSGQAAALNKGIETSQGEIICFLDADDMFAPTKVENIVNILKQLTQEDSDIIISNYIEAIDERGIDMDLNLVDRLSTVCAWEWLKEISNERSKNIADGLTRLSTADRTYQFAAKYRFIPYLGMPTSGLTITRSLANKVFPIPDGLVKISADDFIVKAASLIGSVYLTERVLTKYRIHGKNGWYGSARKIHEVFFEILDDFLNLKLELDGKKPVFSYFNSLHAKSYYRTHLEDRCDRELFALAIKVIYWHVNMTTIIFSIKTIILAISFKLKRLGTKMRLIVS